MLKKILITLTLIILLFILAGCGYGEYKGNVIDKQYIPSRTTIMPVRSGKVTTMIPVHHKEKYEIKIQKEENGEIKETWIIIPKERYENIKIGDYWEE